MKTVFSNKIIAFGLSLAFFIAGLATLADYGVNWDAASHLARGQAYLHYYLTGEQNYSNLPTQKYFQKPDTIFFNPDVPKNEIPRVSIYQYNGDFFKERYEYGHPHISDVLSSVFNFVLFQKLGLLNDIDSYRVYGVLLASLLVGLVFWWTSHSFGKFAGIIAAFSLALYPLFWAESHFNNEKDVPETVFITFMLFSIWRGLTAKSWQWILASGVFFGLALGTKFNVLFSIFVIFPWLGFYLASKYKKSFSLKTFAKSYGRIVFSLVLVPLLGVLIVVGTWPNFWLDPIHKISRMIDFYKTIGTTPSIDQSFIGLFGINTYAPQWILYTTPLLILFMALLGIVAILSRKLKDRQMESWLFLFALVVPILRVTWPGTNIYGGVRQIMEFVPAMAILSGVGAGWLVKAAGKNIKIIIIITVIMIISLIVPIIKLHPNQNVYFNSLIGGLKGAAERDFPGWGVSFGAPYREAIGWINQNAEQRATLTLGTEISSNIPAIFIRPDINYGSKRSGYLRRGEYVITLRFQGASNRSYFDMYLDKMLKPVYQVTVDGVPILKVWKNDKDHLKSEWENEGILDNIKFEKNSQGIYFDIGQVVKLSRLEIEYDESNCPELSWGYFMVSKDGEVWERVPGVLPEEVRSIILGVQPKDGKFIEPFVGQVARYIEFFMSPENTCVTQIQSIKLYYFI